MIIFSEDALEDLERIVLFNDAIDPAWAQRQLATIQRAILILDENPHIGRRLNTSIRELVISSGKTGFVALYEADDGTQTIRVLAIRHQREAGYQRR